MDLPPEVMQVSMRVNQRYFALRTPTAQPAPWFAFVANIEADGRRRAIIAGNERVLRARFADARHFWDLDRKAPPGSPRRGAGRRHVPRPARHPGRARAAPAVAWPARSRRMVGADPAQADRAAQLARPI